MKHTIFHLDEDLEYYRNHYGNIKEYIVNVYSVPATNKKVRYGTIWNAFHGSNSIVKLPEVIYRVRVRLKKD